ncbi:MAG: carboxypeptidase-like regulatory domain-containing protein [Sphingobacteriales bacterium]|nr:MAG: carboxypeptidase-like regulatory domain-containing protein [Sphingobacteriales bacterium]
MRPLFFLFLLILIPFAGQCGSISGKISDQKGETLPFATVFVVGTTVGTSANAAGEYMLQLAPGTYKIACQFIGYKQQVYTAVISDAPLVHNFSLEEQSLEMKAVEVKASEDPALYIMRKVIAKRSFHANQIKTFQTGIYLKGVFKTRQTPNKVLGQKVEAGEMGLDSAGKGILYLCEQVATYYTQGNRDQTIIHSVRESGDPNGLGLSRFPPVINMYENNVKVASGFSPRGFISPVSDAALGYYKFKLEGDFTESGNTIYKIRVTPKRKYEPLFTGVIYIVDDQYALHSVDLLTTKTSNLEFLDSLRVEQIYLPLDKETWIIKQQVMHAAVKLFGFDIVGNFVTVYNDQKVNQQIPDSVFDKNWF